LVDSFTRRVFTGQSCGTNWRIEHLVKDITIDPAPGFCKKYFLAFHRRERTKVRVGATF
jgi:hypothetical protein